MSRLVWPGNFGLQPAAVGTMSRVGAIGLSVVATPGRFIDLLSGEVAASLGSGDAAIIDPILGPTMEANASTANQGFSSDNRFLGGFRATTMAVMFRTSTALGWGHSLLASTSAGGHSFRFNTTQKLAASGSAFGEVATTSLAVTSDRPYLGVYSSSVDTTNGVNFMLVDLYTGLATFEVVTGNYVFGHDGTNPAKINAQSSTNTDPTRIAAALFAVDKFLSLAELAEIAADPWSLWYPADDRSIDLDAQAIAAAGGVTYPQLERDTRGLTRGLFVGGFR